MRKLFKNKVKVTKHNGTGLTLPIEKLIYVVADSQKEALEKIHEKMNGLEIDIEETTFVSKDVIE